VGYARADGDKTLVATLAQVSVLPSYRRQGVGRKLVASLVSTLRTGGIGDIGLIAEPGVQPFFAACGFGPDAEPGAEPSVYMALDAHDVATRRAERPAPEAHLNVSGLTALLLRELETRARVS
jgi:predicted N-acetyltransferase YhbS